MNYKNIVNYLKSKNKIGAAIGLAAVAFFFIECLFSDDRNPVFLIALLLFALVIISPLLHFEHRIKKMYSKAGFTSKKLFEDKINKGIMLSETLCLSDGILYNFNDLDFCTMNDVVALNKLEEFFNGSRRYTIKLGMKDNSKFLIFRNEEKCDDILAKLHDLTAIGMNDDGYGILRK